MTKANGPLFIRDQYRAPLGKEIVKEFNKLVEVISKVSLQDRMVKEIDGTGGKTSVADLIASQIGWGKLVINWYDAGLKGEILKMPGEGFQTWDYIGLAKHFYKKYQFDSSGNQEKEFCRVVLRILNMVEEEFQTGNLDKEGVWAWCTLPSGKQWPLVKWIRVNTSSPYKRASALVRKFLRTKM